MLVLKRPSLRLVIGAASGDQELNSPQRQTCSPAYSAGSSKVTLVVAPFLAGVFVSMGLPPRGPFPRRSATLAAAATGVSPPRVSTSLHVGKRATCQPRVTFWER